MEKRTLIQLLTLATLTLTIFALTRHLHSGPASSAAMAAEFEKTMRSA